jgi:hypothetical protein
VRQLTQLPRKISISYGSLPPSLPHPGGWPRSTPWAGPFYCSGGPATGGLLHPCDYPGASPGGPLLRGGCLTPWAVESGLAAHIVDVGNNHPVAIAVWALVSGTRRQPRAVTPIAFDHRSQLRFACSPRDDRVLQLDHFDRDLRARRHGRSPPAVLHFSAASPQSTFPSVMRPGRTGSLSRQREIMFEADSRPQEMA